MGTLTLKTAKKLSDPWRRCQALAQLALETSDRDQVDAVLKRAFASALELSDINRQVTVSAWPLKVLCRRGTPAKLFAETRRVVELAATDPSPVRRADALNTVLGAIVTGPRELLLEVLDRLKVACQTPLASGRPNAKGHSHLATWVGVVACIDGALAREMLEWIPGPTLRDRAEKSIALNEGADVNEVCSWPNIGRGGSPGWSTPAV